MAPRRRGRPAAFGLEESLEDRHRALRDPDATSRSPRPSRFARRLEAFYDLFFALMADVVGEQLPLARRFRSPVADRGSRRTGPIRFTTSPSKDEYVEHLRSLGRRRTSTRAWVITTRPGPARATAPRPTSSATPAASSPSRPRSTTRSRTSSCSRRPGPTPTRGTRGITGSSRAWAPTSRRSRPEPTARSRSAAWSASGSRRPASRSRPAGSCPSSSSSGSTRTRFNRDDRIHVNYQQAMALTVFLMQGDDAAYRDAFLDYVRDAYRGRIKRRHRPIARRSARRAARRCSRPNSASSSAGARRTSGEPGAASSSPGIGVAHRVAVERSSRVPAEARTHSPT